MLTDRDMVGLDPVTPEYIRQQYFLCFPRVEGDITGIVRPSEARKDGQHYSLVVEGVASESEKGNDSRYARTF